MSSSVPTFSRSLIDDFINLVASTAAPPRDSHKSSGGKDVKMAEDGGEEPPQDSMSAL